MVCLSPMSTTPMLAVTRRSTPSWVCENSRTRSRMSWATNRAAAASARGRSRANSSPPSRATRSPSRRFSARSPDMAVISSSPTPWPRVSLTSLKWSRSSSRSAPLAPLVWQAARCRVVSVSNRCRFASPVSASCSVRWTRRSRCVISAVWSTTWETTSRPSAPWAPTAVLVRDRWSGEPSAASAVHWLSARPSSDAVCRWSSRPSCPSAVSAVSGVPASSSGVRPTRVAKAGFASTSAPVASVTTIPFGESSKSSLVLSLAAAGAGVAVCVATAGASTASVSARRPMNSPRAPATRAAAARPCAASRANGGRASPTRPTRTRRR